MIEFKGITKSFGSHTVLDHLDLNIPQGQVTCDTKLLKKMNKEIKKETNGDVNFKIYAGGISGDELDVLRKMKSNRIHAGGFSGVGLGVILPEIRVLEAPLLFRNHEEIDLVKEKLFDRFAKNFEKKGYILLGFAEAGFVYVFSKKNINSDASLKQTKIWVWKGDLVAENFLKEFGIRTPHFTSQM